MWWHTWWAGFLSNWNHWCENFVIHLDFIQFPLRLPYGQLYSSPSDRTTREKKTKKNINKQLHNTHSKRKAQTTVMHMALCQPTSIIGSATKQTRIRCRQIYKDNKESSNKRLLQELYLVRNILDLSAVMALDNLKPNTSWHSVTVCISQISNNFIKNRLTEKSNDLRLALVKGHASSPYSRIGRHLDLINSKTTSSDAVLPIFPKIQFTAR